MPRLTKGERRHKSIYDLLDKYCPAYQETKDGSTEFGAAVLAVYALLDGRYVWQTAYTRSKFLDGSRANWWIGNQPVAGPQAQVCKSFADAVTAARVELGRIGLPRWTV